MLKIPVRLKILLHILADTYGHMKMEYEYTDIPEIRMERQGIYTVETFRRLTGFVVGDGTYMAPLGHSPDGTDPEPPPKK